MKIQNAAMEFVTFDAQDVIATSGPIPAPTTISFKVTEGLFDLREGWTLTSNEWETYWGNNGSTFHISYQNDPLKKDTYYTISKGAYYEYGGLTETDGLEFGTLSLWDNVSEGDNGKPYTSLSSILAWLEGNGAQ